jgi:hypothetical protein
MIDAILNAAPAWALTHAAPLLVMVPLFLAPLLALVPTGRVRVADLDRGHGHQLPVRADPAGP